MRGRTVICWEELLVNGGTLARALDQQQVTSFSMTATVHFEGLVLKVLKAAGAGARAMVVIDVPSKKRKRRKK